MLLVYENNIEYYSIYKPMTILNNFFSKTLNLFINYRIYLKQIKLFYYLLPVWISSKFGCLRTKLFFRVSWFIFTFDFGLHAKKLNKRRPHNAASELCWFLQSTGKSFQEFIRTPMSHCSSRRVIRTVRLSHPVV